MKKPAARLGDLTSHGTPLIGMCSMNVFIGFMPAWRVLDFHICPMVTGPIPHVGGPVLKGSMKVFINKRPAARFGDRLTEIGPPNTIITGYPKVLIG